MMGIIYYTDNYKLDKPIIPLVRKFIAASGLPITSASLKPIKFGDNVVVKGKRGVHSWARQILAALERSKAKYVFFCEHDVLYHKTHFDFRPFKDDVFYYNVNVWRWRYHANKVITHGSIWSLSGMCCNRKFAIKYFKRYLEVLEENGIDKDFQGQPRWVRGMGFEPGRSMNGKRGMPIAKSGSWRSKYPNVDIRHKHCFTNRKTNIRSCHKKPKDWRDHTIDEIPGWNIRKLVGKYLYINHGAKRSNR